MIDAPAAEAKECMARQSETDGDEEESQSQLPQSRIFLHQDPWRFNVRLGRQQRAPLAFFRSGYVGEPGLEPAAVCFV